MPNPKKNESKQDYLKRCTAELIGDEDANLDQAFAMCNSMWRESKDAELSELRHGFNLSAPMQLDEILDEGDPGKTSHDSGFLINAYTGKVVEMGWWGDFIFDVEGIEAANQMPVLREHARDSIVGASSKFWKDKSNVFIQGKFSEATESSREVKALAEEGYPWQASVGIWPLDVEYLEDSAEKAEVNGIEVEGPLEIWRKSHIREVSFVSLGADDDTAGIGMHLSNACPVQVQVKYSSQITDAKEGKQMELKELLEKLTEAAPSHDDLATTFPEFAEHCINRGKEEGEQGYIKQGREMGKDEEKARIVEILEADASPEVTLKAIEDGTLAADFYKLAYAHMRGEQDKGLDDLKTSAGKDIVPKEPTEPDLTSVEDAGVKVAVLATALAKEEGLDIPAATSRVLKENPELKDQYLGSFNS